MHYEVDQSGKVEDTARQTVLAITNGSRFSIVLKQSEKRAIQLIFRQQGHYKYFSYFVFSALLAILFNEARVKNRILVDREYFGHENTIKERLGIYLKRLNFKVKPEIIFGFVGKTSKAHILAGKVSHGLVKSQKSVRKEEILELIFPNKKDRVSLKKRPGAI